MKFKSARSIFVALALWGAIALLLFSSALILQQGGPGQWLLILLAMVVVFIVWSWFATYYVINGDELSYRSGPIHGKISISSIRIITVNKTLYAGLKPALASNGCVIEYNKYDEIYMSPQDKEGFIAALLNVNAIIEVRQNK
ncbi:PH domain-containing protein [uncultured Mucilaginibacter sp.]|uniref:PH domain-containing protein n=1 Tax=uncultured Mucilaginibacter sp. TaxID=797541 RepID=UPI0025CE97EF|nr:PH domain-containing protein [uncultured Mucilaginibacter sp.]